MRKVLIITYYWPPVNSAGVYRWLKFVKYLRDFQWEPIVYTIERNVEGKEEGLQKDIPKGVTVLTKPIKDPFDLYQKLTGKGKQTAQPGFLKEKEGSDLPRKFLFWIRGNFFIPDAKKSWVKPSVEFLSAYIEEQGIDALVTTGPPHSMHLIGLGLKKKTNIKWLADFRDPWTNIDFYDRLNLSRTADRKHKKLEIEVLSTADEVTTVSKTLARELEEIHERTVRVVTNGYDGADFENIRPIHNHKFTIVQTGSMNEDRDPRVLWAALRKMMDRVEGAADSVKVKLIGPVDQKVLGSVREYGLEEVVEISGLMVHEMAIAEMVGAHLLLLPINRSRNKSGIVPGKFYEYLRSGSPILCIGPPEGDAADIIHATNSGSVHDYSDEAGVLEKLQAYYEAFLSDGLTSNARDITKYSRRELTREMAALLDAMCAE